MNYIKLFDTQVADKLKKAMKILFKNPKSAYALTKISAHMKKAEKARNIWLNKGVTVPPLLIVSTTEKCNLRCKSCYSTDVCRENNKELSKERISTLLGEISIAGCSVILLAGGEPLLSKDWLYSVAEHKELLGLVFTNGMLLDEKWYSFFSVKRNMFLLFSIEGTPEMTDSRRGLGVHEKIEKAMKEMQKRRVPFGISITVSSCNINTVTSQSFIDGYIKLGCKLFIYVEYVPVGKENTYLPLTFEEKNWLSEFCNQSSLQNTNKAILIVFPGNEEKYDGCLAAGRGFLHITTSGALEPCPFAPYSDANISEMPFIEALKSPFLETLRTNSNALHEGVGGCSLRNKEEWISGILNDSVKG